MAGSEKRVTRSSTKQKTECVDKQHTSNSSQAENTVDSVGITVEKEAVADVTGSSFTQPPTSENGNCVSESIRISKRNRKCQQNRANNSRKKRRCPEDDAEIENGKLSKTNAHRIEMDVIPTCSSSSSRKQVKSNNHCGESKARMRPNSGNRTKTVSVSVSKKTSQVKENSHASTSSSIPRPDKHFNKNQGMQNHQNQRSQHETINSMNSINIYHHCFNSSLGKFQISMYHAPPPVARKIASHLAHYEVACSDQPFQSRLTSIEWHPRKRNFLGIGSKHGDVAFYNVRSEDYSRLDVVATSLGIGPGGNISSMKFHPTKDNLVYTSSLCGKVVLRDFEMRQHDVLLDTMSWDFWFSSLDVHKTEFLVCAGKNKGGAVLLDKDGKTIWEKRLHRQKISHLEFSPRDPNLFCTASLDHSVKLWDLRKIVEKMPLEKLDHKRGVNSAYFSLTDGCRLLTTDQNDELRVYTSPLWNLERTIIHPHRFFQHLTPIKAYWHPHVDLILCGRYPDLQHSPEFRLERCIDIFDASSGQRLGEMIDYDFHGITSLVKMNHEGNKLVSGMGFKLNLWNQEPLELQLESIATPHRIQMNDAAKSSSSTKAQQQVMTASLLKRRNKKNTEFDRNTMKTDLKLKFK